MPNPKNAKAIEMTDAVVLQINRLIAIDLKANSLFNRTIWIELMPVIIIEMPITLNTFLSMGIL